MLTIEERIDAAADVLAALAPDGDSPALYAIRDALDAALSDVEGVGGLQALLASLAQNGLLDLKAERDELRDALRGILDGEPGDADDAWRNAEHALRESDERRSSA